MNKIVIGILLAIFIIQTVYVYIKARRPPKQTCFVYCPNCHNELVSSNSFVEDHDGIVEYKRDMCGWVSFWDFAHYPVPYLLEYDIRTM